MSKRTVITKPHVCPRCGNDVLDELLDGLTYSKIFWRCPDCQWATPLYPLAKFKIHYPEEHKDE
ncbi:MAG TPA: hypothetical protein VMW50_03020 [Dehalococcoidia bacterium]|nr:hypothetical protein [Dehalococcoidia bacterium]